MIDHVQGIFYRRTPNGLVMFPTAPTTEEPIREADPGDEQPSEEETSVGKSLKRYDPAMKRQVLKDVRASNESVAAVAKRHGLNSKIVYNWITAEKRKKTKKREVRAGLKKTRPVVWETKPAMTIPASAGTTVVINGVSITVKNRQVTISF